MPHNFGNVVYGNNVAVVHADPGWVTVIWHGVALIGQPAKEWPILDSTNQPLVVTAGNKIRDVAFTLYKPCIGTAGDRLKVAASVTDTNAYVVQSLPVNNNGFLVDQGQQQLSDFTLTTNFTPKLWLHGNNTDPGTRTLQGTNQTPPGAIVAPGNSPESIPVRVDVRVVWQQRVGAPTVDDGIMLSRQQQEALQVIYRSDLIP
jgi:hypothetical protein